MDAAGFLLAGLLFELPGVALPVLAKAGQDASETSTVMDIGPPCKDLPVTKKRARGCRGECNLGATIHAST